MKQENSLKKPNELDKKQEKLEFGLNDTGEGVEVQQGAVELDVNMVQETVELQVNDKPWIRISFASLFRCFTGIGTCCINACKKKETPPVASPEKTAPAEPTQAETVVQQ